MVDKDSHRRFPIRKKLLLLAFTAAIPFLAVAVYLLVSMANYSQSYSDIVSNLTVAISIIWTLKRLWMKASTRW